MHTMPDSAMDEPWPLPQWTGRQPGLLQDDCAGLSKWLAEKPGARRLALEAAEAVGSNGQVQRLPAG